MTQISFRRRTGEVRWRRSHPLFLLFKVSAVFLGAVYFLFFHKIIPAHIPHHAPPRNSSLSPPSSFLPPSFFPSKDSGADSDESETQPAFFGADSGARTSHQTQPSVKKRVSEPIEIGAPIQVSDELVSNSRMQSKQGSKQPVQRQNSQPTTLVLSEPIPVSCLGLSPDRFPPPPFTQ